jgi:amidase
MQRILRASALGYAFDGSLAPVLRVAAGEPFAVETEDASSGLLARGDRRPVPEDLPYLRHVPPKSNPVAGPVHVDGVRAGGRVTVEIADIRLEPYGTTWGRPAISPLGDSAEWAGATGPYVERVEHRGREAVLSDRLRWPLAPMIGTLACAPEWEVHSSSTGQGAWGGNLDVAEYRPGALVHLNAHHDGALLFVGDVHGCQGDGEYSGIADESRAEVVLRAAPADGQPLPAPRVETPEAIVALAIDKPLEAAAHGAVRHLMSWLVSDFGFSPREAYLAVSLNPEFRLRIHQMTAIRELRFVVGATLPRRFLA